MSKVFYIADLHFGHKNIIRYDNRPFKTVEEMDKALIERWNRAVSKEDFVFILGDISWYDDEKTADIFEQLNGTKVIVRGNHDNIKPNTRLARCFSGTQSYYEYYYNKKNKVIMCHYPIPCFKNHFYGWFHLCGHTHISFEHNMMENDKFEIKALYDRPCNMYNVGCMHPWMNYTPRTLSEIISGYEQYLASTKPEEQVEAGGLRPCPYCGGSDIRYSIKSTTLQFKKAYHASMYCWDCNSYGPRVLYKSDEHRYDVEHNENLRKQAESLWNRRG